LKYWIRSEVYGGNKSRCSKELNILRSKLINWEKKGEEDYKVLRNSRGSSIKMRRNMFVNENEDDNDDD
jgi:hypothetical protein